MEPRASYIAVGSFVVVLIAAAMVFVTWLTGTQLEDDGRSYIIYFTDNVTGLQVGSPIRYRGVSVGTVNRIRIDPTNVERIEIQVDIPRDVPIKQDTRAALEMQGLTGQAYVNLTGGTDESPPLTRQEGQTAPVIEATPSAIQSILTGAPALLAKLITIAERFEDLLNDENRGSLAATLANVEQFSAQLTTAGNEITVTTERVREVAASVASLTETLDSEVLVVTDEFAQTALEARTALRSIERAATEVRGLLNDNREPIRDFTSQGLYEFGLLLSELRALATNLSSLTSRLERDPADLLRGATGGVRAP